MWNHLCQISTEAVEGISRVLFIAVCALSVAADGQTTAD